MGIIGSHVDLTSGCRGHQANIEADGASRSENWSDGDLPPTMAEGLGTVWDHFPTTPFELSRVRRQACGGGSILGRRIADTASLQYAYRRMAPAHLLLDDSRKQQNRPKLINPHKAIK